MILSQQCWGTEAAIRSIISYCRCTPLWLFHEAMPNIVDSPLRLIFSMWQRACHLPILVYRRLIHSQLKDVTIQPTDCRLCKTTNRWHSFDAHIDHGETSFEHSIIACNQSYTHYRHSILSLSVLSFASSRFISFLCLLIPALTKQVSWCLRENLKSLLWLLGGYTQG